MTLKTLLESKFPDPFELKDDCNDGKAYLKYKGSGTDDRLTKAIKYVSGKYRLVWEGHVDRIQYTYDEILYMVRKENWRYSNTDT